MEYFINEGSRQKDAAMRMLINEDSSDDLLLDILNISIRD